MRSIDSGGSPLDRAEALREVLVREISARGRITFPCYLQLVLHHPQYGYYSSVPPRIGPHGDFYSSPDVSPLFGAVLGRQVLNVWRALGAPRQFTVVEYGAGKGLLASDLLSWLQAAHPGVLAALDYGIIEISPTLRTYQKQLLSHLPVRWMDEQALPLGKLVGCFISNEVADALPWHRVVGSPDGLHELWVTLDGDRLAGQWAELSTPEIEQQLATEGIRLPPGSVADVSLAAPKWLARQVQALSHGVVLVIDYGAHAARLYGPLYSEGTLACYYKHTLNRDPFLRPGEQDITAHVDFTALSTSGAAAGGQLLGYTTQAYFLASLGLGEALTSAGERAGPPGEYMRERARIARLIDPAGLGGFRVLAVGVGMQAVRLQGFALRDERELLSRPFDLATGTALE